uniref:Uncharacterized protein n=1 Tax=Parascaris univalens TaxID=6257 RepID=A0A915AQW0_PARUN
MGFLSDNRHYLHCRLFLRSKIAFGDVGKQQNEIRCRGNARIVCDRIAVEC